MILLRGEISLSGRYSDEINRLQAGGDSFCSERQKKEAALIQNSLLQKNLRENYFRRSIFFVSVNLPEVIV